MNEQFLKNLNSAETIFWNALMDDYQKRGEKSFIETIFLSGPNINNDINYKITRLFDGEYQKLFDNSDLLLSSIDSVMIGKYKDYYWATGSEGELYSVGRQLQNLPYVLIDTLGDYTDTEAVERYFRNILHVDFQQYLQDYVDFCRSFGLDYNPDPEMMGQEAEGFEELLEDLR